MTDTTIMTLPQAINKYVHKGDSIALGGCTTNRKPYAAVREIIRQGIKELHIETGAAGGDVDLLIGAGSCKSINTSYVADSGYSNVSRRYRKFIEENKIAFEDYSLDVQMILFHAAALGLPYVPVKHMLGSDLVNKWGMSREYRRNNPKVFHEKLIVANNPFNDQEKVCLVPTPNIDVAIIHVQKAASDGTARIEGSIFADVDLSIAAKYCIVICEELIDIDNIRREPYLNHICSLTVNAVVHLPFGAYPSQVYNYYDYDRDYLRMYDKISKEDQLFEKFIHEWILDIHDHTEFLNKLGKDKLNTIQNRMKKLK